MSDTRKPIHEISTEELLEALNNADNEILPDKLTHAAKFIYQFEVKAGETKVPAALIYHTYKNWAGKDYAEPKWKFFRDFSKRFDKKHIRGETVYYLDPKPFDMSKETWWEIRRESRARREEYRRKKLAKNAAKEEDKTK